MAILTIQDADVSGLANVAFVAATALGDEVPTGAGVALLVRNTDVATKTVTINTPGTVRGLDIANPAVIVPATTGLAVIPMIRQVFGASAQITYSAVTGLTVAAVRLAR